MGARGRVDAREIVPIALGLAGFALVALAFYPGFMSWDSAYQYWQLRRLAFTTQHPPVMGLLWWLTDRVVEGPGGLFLLHGFVYWGSLVAIARAAFRGVFARSGFVVVVGLWPPHLVLLPHLWKDVGLMVALLAATACWLGFLASRNRMPDHDADQDAGRDGSARASRGSSTGRGWLVGMAVVLLYAVTVRHNALPAAIPFFAWLGVAWASRGRARGLPVTRRPRAALMGVALGLVLSIAANAAIQALPIVRVQSVWPTLMLWDLARVSGEVDEMLLPAFTRPPERTLDEVRAASIPWDNVSTFVRIGLRTGLEDPFTPAQSRAIRSAWGRMLRDHPIAYLEHRRALARHLFLLEDHPARWPGRFDAGILPYRDNPRFERRQSELGDRLVGLLRWDLHRLHHRGWVYVLLSLAGAGIAFAGRRRPLAELALGVYASGLLYALPLVFVAPSAATRFLGWLVAASMVGTGLLLGAWGGGRRGGGVPGLSRRSSDDSPGPG